MVSSEKSVAHCEPQGGEIPLEVNLTRIQWSGRQFIQALITDITERKQAEHALRDANRELRREIEQRSRAEELLKRGYATPGVRNRQDIADRLAMLYRETGRDGEADALTAEARRTGRSNAGVSVRRTIDLVDAGDHAVVRDTATATFEGEGFPLERMAEIVAALDAAGPSIALRRATKVARNAPCPCGSGQKYKKCCGRN